VRLWNLETREALAIARLIAAASVAATRDRIVAGTSAGEVLFFDVRGLS
jgi:hypothetical protein